MIRHAVSTLTALWLLALPAIGQQVTVAQTGETYASLSVALGAASPGDTLEVSGRFTGSFSVPVPLTLTGRGDAELHGGGAGTVLVIAADDVTVENLTVTGSGRDSTWRTIWGNAGIRVDGDRATLSGLTVRDNDWGILLRGGADSTIMASVIEENARDGVKIMGGTRHRVLLSEVNRNQIGIAVDALYGDAREMVIPDWDDREAQECVSRMKETAQPSQGIVIADNEVRGNGSLGIVVSWKSHRNEILRNHVFRTGLEIEPDSAGQMQVLAALAGAAGIPPEELEGIGGGHIGSGIFISCLPEENRVIANHSHDNLAYGIALNVTYRNSVAKNRVDGNLVGIDLDAVEDSRFEANTVRGNSDFGIRVDTIAGPQPMPQASTGNLFALNTLSANGVNAFDSSGVTLSRAQIERRIENAPWPDALRQQVLANESRRRMMIDSMFERQAPGQNRWDDGALGNHYGDFDEAAEGFTDADGDGIGETPHAIPGGGHVDRFPLTAARAAEEGAKD